MARTTWLFVALLHLTLLGCERMEVKKYLIDQWSYDLPAIRDEMQLRGSDYAEVNYMESIMAGLQFAGLEFSEKGRMHFELDSLRQSGSWRLRKNGKEIVLRLTDKPQKYALERRGRDTLVLDPLSGEGLAFPRMLIRKPKE